VLATVASNSAGIGPVVLARPSAFIFRPDGHVRDAHETDVDHLDATRIYEPNTYQYGLKQLRTARDVAARI
jgi:hypothetical protein